MRPLTCTRLQNTQNLEVKPPLKLQRWLKNASFCENSCLHGKCLAYGKVWHKFYRKNYFKKCCLHNRKTLHKIKQTETESLADEYKFFLNTINLQKTLKIWLTFLKSKINPPIGIILCLLVVLQYLIKDTHAQCNVILLESLENLSPKLDLQRVNVKLSVYNGSKILVVGKCSLL